MCAPRVPWPPAFTAGPSPCTPLAPPSPHAHPRLAHPASHRTVCLSRQGASAFNQPLNFDTSSVTNMFGMFYVRSSPCPTCPDMQSSPPLHAACTAVARHLPPPCLQLAPHRTPFFRLSAGCVGVQPAAEFRHLQRHRHGRRVLRRVGLQPAAEPRHLQRHEHVRNVLRALLPAPCPQSAVEPSPTRCVHRGRPPPLARSRSAPRLASHALLSTLGRARRRSTSR